MSNEMVDVRYYPGAYSRILWLLPDLNSPVTGLYI